MSKTAKFTIGERLAMESMFNLFKGTTAELAAILSDVKEAVVSNEEWIATKGQVIGPDGKAKDVGSRRDATNGDSLKWDPTLTETDKELTLQSETVEYLKRAIKEKSDKNEITLTDLPLLSIQDKIK